MPEQDTQRDTPSGTQDAIQRRLASVLVIVVCYNGREYLPDCLQSIADSQDPGVQKSVVVVDNASQDGSEDYVRREFPTVTLLPAGANLGFAEANNLAWRVASEQTAPIDYVYLLNQDTIVASGWLQAIVDYLQQHPSVGSVQSKLLLHPETTLINTLGNQSHYLGFGIPAGYRCPDDGRFEQPTSINYASGAGVMVRAELLRQVGLFEPGMFMYLEDADLSWKIRQLGYDVHMLPASRVYHKYRFNKGYRFYYELERNRWWLLLVYYHGATLVLLAPALLLMEGGQLLFAASRGRLLDKFRSYGFFLQPRNASLIWRLRCAAQQRRTIPDRQFLQHFVGRIESPELRGLLIRYVANPIFAAYWSVVRRLIFW